MGHAPGAHRPSQTRRVPRPLARRFPAASPGAAAPAGMALATALDSANVLVPSPASGEGRVPISQ